jgi:hypothetical protein
VGPALQDRKNHCGTLVEINLQREFDFRNGDKLDYEIAGADVDCKYSQTMGGWMIPPEARGELCLLLWAEDNKEPAWSMGLVRATTDHLNTGSNRDSKATLNGAGRNAIAWLFKSAPLPPNVLWQLDPKTVGSITALKSGQKRINQPFRPALRETVGRAVVATVGQQGHYLKEARAIRVARTALRAEGIVILGQYESHAAIARALGVPVPGRGESVSLRIFPAQSPGTGVANINGRLWRVARDGDPVVRAPDLPKIQPKSRVASRSGGEK